MPRISTGLARLSRTIPVSMTPASPTSGPDRRRGVVEVSPRAVATTAGRAVAECYGVIGIAASRPHFASVELLSPEHYSRGVVVQLDEDRLIIDVYVVLEHGLRITEIAHNIMANVRFAVERSLGSRVGCVNVNVQALRVNGREHLDR